MEEKVVYTTRVGGGGAGVAHIVLHNLYQENFYKISEVELVLHVGSRSWPLSSYQEIMKFLGLYNLNIRGSE